MMSMVEFGRTNVAGICVGIAQGALERSPPSSGNA